MRYTYDETGERTNKWTADSETLYFSKFWSHQTDGNNRSLFGGEASKHIFLNEERIVTKLHCGENWSVGEELNRQFFYHSNHIGSVALVTDREGCEYERLEYTPYGEVWLDKSDNTAVKTPFRFTAKEMDDETGLYYFGARYLDPKYSRWMSTDPALNDYLDKTKGGEGGIYNHINLNVYHYGSNNPIKYIDPDGNINWNVVQKGITNIVKGIGKVGFGSFLASASSGVLTVAGGAYVANGFVQTVMGVAEVVAGLSMDENTPDPTAEMSDTLNDVLAVPADAIKTAIAGEESTTFKDVANKIDDVMDTIPPTNDVKEMLLTPTELPPEPTPQYNFNLQEQEG